MHSIRHRSIGYLPYSVTLSPQALVLPMNYPMICLKNEIETYRDSSLTGLSRTVPMDDHSSHQNQTEMSFWIVISNQTTTKVISDIQTIDAGYNLPASKFRANADNPEACYGNKHGLWGLVVWFPIHASAFIHFAGSDQGCSRVQVS